MADKDQRQPSSIPSHCQRSNEASGTATFLYDAANESCDELANPQQSTRSVAVRAGLPSPPNSDDSRRPSDLKTNTNSRSNATSEQAAFQQTTTTSRRSCAVEQQFPWSRPSSK